MTSATMCSEICGDGIISAAQTCDDRNSNSGDGCSSLCLIEAGYSCVGTSNSTCSPICGDGKVISPETCDDGPNDNIGCNSTCKGFV